MLLIFLTEFIFFGTLKSFLCPKRGEFTLTGALCYEMTFLMSARGKVLSLAKVVALMLSNCVSKLLSLKFTVIGVFVSPDRLFSLDENGEMSSPFFSCAGRFATMGLRSGDSLSSEERKIELFPEFLPVSSAPEEIRFELLPKV